MTKVKLSKYLKTLCYKPRLSNELYKIVKKVPSAKAAVFEYNIKPPQQAITIITNDPNNSESLFVITDLVNFIPRREEILLTARVTKEMLQFTSPEPPEPLVIYKYGRPTKYDTNTAAKIKQLIQEGKSIRKIAKELNMSPTTVQKLKNAAENCKLLEVFDPQNQAV